MKTLSQAILAAAIAIGLVTVTAIEPAHAGPGTNRARPAATKRPAKTTPTKTTPASPRDAAKPAQSPRSRANTRASARDARDEHRRKLKQMTFELGDEIEGGVAGPNHDTVTARGQLLHSNLIRVREDFLPEIHKSVESL